MSTPAEAVDPLELDDLELGMAALIARPEIPVPVAGEVMEDGRIEWAEP